MTHKIAFVNAHTHESTYLVNIDGDDYEFDSYQDAIDQKDIWHDPMKNGKFVVVEQYDH